jgi:hypothetical protein
MKKMKVIIKKIFAISLAMSFVFSTAFSAKVHANENVGERFEDDNYKISQKENIVTIYDKLTKKEIVMTIKNENEAVLKYSNGDVKEVTRENNIIYLDDKVTVKPQLKQYSIQGKSNNLSKAARTWHYYQTIYYNTKTKGDIESIALGIFSFCPYVGKIIGIVAIIKTARNMGAKTMYVKVKQYYYTGYSKYKYENYFYANKSRTKLIKHTTTYKKMW